MGARSRVIHRLSPSLHPYPQNPVRPLIHHPASAKVSAQTHPHHPPDGAGT